MDADDIIITDVHDAAAVAELSDRVIAFNVETTGYDDGRSLSCFLRDGNGELYAGLDGFTWGGYAMIEWLWVAGSKRGQGLGARLVRAAEAEAAARDCVVIRVDTHTFQAPDFYRSLGYEEIGRAADAPFAHGEFFFSKRLLPGE